MVVAKGDGKAMLLCLGDRGVDHFGQRPVPGGLVSVKNRPGRSFLDHFRLSIDVELSLLQRHVKRLPDTETLGQLALTYADHQAIRHGISMLFAGAISHPDTLEAIVEEICISFFCNTF